MKLNFNNLFSILSDRINDTHGFYTYTSEILLFTNSFEFKTNRFKFLSTSHDHDAQISNRIIKNFIS